MSDETPVIRHRSKKLKRDQSGDQSGLVCITHYAHNTGDTVTKLTEHAFQVIKEAASVRQQQVDPKARLDEICAHIPALFISEVHGRQEKCYKAFTNTSYLKLCDTTCSKNESVGTTPPTIAKRSSSRSSSAATAVLFPKDRCLFCDKGKRFKKGVTDEMVQRLTTEAAETIQQTARQNNDFALLGKIAGIDLVAREELPRR